MDAQPRVKNYAPVKMDKSKGGADRNMDKGMDKDIHIPVGGDRFGKNIK